MYLPWRLFAAPPSVCPMLPLPLDYPQFLVDITQRVRAAQYRAKVSTTCQQQHGWGRHVVETLARNLQAEFVGMCGFSGQNLWYMRQFYLEYSASALLQPLVREISWAKHLLILSKCKDAHERQFYTLQTRRQNWTKAVLAQQLKGQAYQRTVLAQHNFADTLPTVNRVPATLALKDECLFDFLELGAEHSEYGLEQALLANVRRFLSELGGDFTFIGNQYRLELEGREYFVDLLLFHRELQCLVAVELKIDEFRPKYAGKMNFYLSLLNQTVRKAHEQPSIGIIICQSKQRTMVEFALRDVNKPIGVATYTYTNTLPSELQPFFPSNEELVQRLQAVTAALQGGAAPPAPMNVPLGPEQ